MRSALVNVFGMAKGRSWRVAGCKWSRLAQVHINPFVYGGEPVGRWIISHNRFDNLMQFLF